MSVEEGIDEEFREKLLYEVAVACYNIYHYINSEVDEIVSDPVSFKALLGGYIFLYERYKGITKAETKH